MGRVRELPKVWSVLLVIDHRAMRCAATELYNAALSIIAQRPCARHVRSLHCSAMSVRESSAAESLRAWNKRSDERTLAQRRFGTCVIFATLQVSLRAATLRHSFSVPMSRICYRGCFA
jgi:hypothetical protein